MPKPQKRLAGANPTSDAISDAISDATMTGVGSRPREGSAQPAPENTWRSTTILAVRRERHVVLAGDGQVSLGATILKHGAKKLRRLYRERVLAGFAGSTADAFALFERFEAKLADSSGDVTRAAVELAKDWRTDRALRRLEAMLLVADAHRTLVLSGSGDVVEPDDGVVAIGSGAPMATAAARALWHHTSLDARAIAEAAMTIAADLCVYTNGQFQFEELSS